ncbi:MAG: hypothetical protein P3W94_002750 [Paracoccus sp. (in: a-proteobacteria)]|nr:hypothetical protein [Paracoccus sp. (in: a-proteobacteria)]
MACVILGVAGLSVRARQGRLALAPRSGRRGVAAALDAGRF